MTAIVSALLTIGLSVANAPLAAAANTTQLYNDAQNAFAHGDAAGGIGKLGELLGAAPNDTDALALRAIWADYAGDRGAKIDASAKLGADDPSRQAGVDNVLRVISTAALTPPNPFPSFQGPQTAVVVLGFGLLPNGALRPELVSRLQAVAIQSITAPASPIIVTGGNPQNGITEAAAMKDWLVRHLVPEGRIHVEDRAGSTVENALFSTQMIRDLGAVNAAVVTSANHIRRATADFTIAGTPVVGAMSTLDQIVSQILPLSKANQRGMYLDATRVFGLPATR
ncbi:YdcF family protein [Antrihabitans cavernicola]|uniref:YdcF family protein n=1 Tax=Antrihabitans cavernicola TaxID=2495913 RepID=UPI001F2C67F3|nr:YdcF family protein [Spelaeibacter cavernicola]